jgi:hypothetical protein
MRSDGDGRDEVTLARGLKISESAGLIADKAPHLTSPHPSRTGSQLGITLDSDGQKKYLYISLFTRILFTYDTIFASSALVL